MKQSLQLRMGQQLTMTPQLQQAIKLLQLSSLELQQEIQQALESNMMLEVDETESLKPLDDSETVVAAEPKSEDNSDFALDIPDELSLDLSWESIYDDALVPHTSASKGEGDFELQQSSKAQSLQEYLLAQLELAVLSEKDQAIARAIIDAVNLDGYLNTDLDDIYLGLTEQIEDLDFEEVVAVLHTVQNFDPTGVAAIDLADCLSLQLRQLPATHPHKKNALALVKSHLLLLANGDLDKLARELKVSEIQLESIISLIKQLNPKPGSQLQSVEYQYIIPDVFVIKREGLWQVSLNPEISPKLRINPLYAGMIKRADSSQDNCSMKNHLQEAKWLIKSLHGRNETLLRVAQSIIDKQQDFLEHGAVAMRAMVLRDIAQELELHESTISRITTHKYMHTPNGIVEFKYFFSSHVSTTEGGECSSTAIRAFIKELIGNELPSKPLSDDKIAVLLQAKGINIARRTIAKYREAMSISASNQRKRSL